MEYQWKIGRALVRTSLRQAAGKVPRNSCSLARVAVAPEHTLQIQIMFGLGAFARHAAALLLDLTPKLIDTCSISAALCPQL